VEFGVDHRADVTGTFRERGLETEIVLKTAQGSATTTIRAPGVHNVRNALAAAAAAIALNVPVDTIALGLSRYAGVKGRLQMKTGRHGATVIDDTYNANPESVRAAIDVLARASGRKVLVFGDMGELGQGAPQLHAELGAYAKKAGIDDLITLGQNSARTTETFGPDARHYERIEDLIADTTSVLAPDVTVLVKGSRFMRMERVVAALEAAQSAGGTREEKK
jgi:UDP-N-acetylmuramoyl-tripeptide--D-alanyl-D-alanine ligase